MKDNLCEGCYYNDKCDYFQKCDDYTPCDSISEAEYTDAIIEVRRYEYYEAWNEYITECEN